MRTLGIRVCCVALQILSGTLVTIGAALFSSVLLGPLLERAHTLWIPAVLHSLALAVPAWAGITLTAAAWESLATSLGAGSTGRAPPTSLLRSVAGFLAGILLGLGVPVLALSTMGNGGESLPGIAACASAPTVGLLVARVVIRGGWFVAPSGSVPEAVAVEDRTQRDGGPGPDR